MSEIDLDKMVDICRGKMTLKELNREIAFYMQQKNPELLVVTIEKNLDRGGYISTLYVSRRDFFK